MMDWTPPPPLACSLTPIHAPTPLGGMAAITGFLLASYTTKEYALSHGAPYPNDWLNRPGCAAGRRNSRDHSGTQATARAKKREVDTVHAAVESLRRLSAS